MLCACSRGPITFVAAGDLHPVRGLEVLPAADVRLVNLEEPLTTRGAPSGLEADGRPLPGARIRFAGDPAGAALLRGHIDVASLANNHALDQGAEGREDTVRTLLAQGIAAAWPGHDAVLERRRQRVAIVARDVERDDEDEIVRAITAAHEHAVVVASLHWGSEGSLLPNRAQKQLAARLVDAGAVAVIGHGPHTLQGIERRGRAIIAYSVGNLALGCRCSEVTDAYALAFRIGPSGAVDDVRALPIRAGIAGQPPERSHDAGLADLIATLSRDLGSHAEVVSGEVRIE